MRQGNLDFGRQRIGALVIDSRIGNHGRRCFVSPSVGYQAIIDECAPTYQVDLIGVEEIAEYPTILASMHSPLEIEKLYHAAPQKADHNVAVVGGFGALNPWAVYDFADVLVFGRAEDQVDAILRGDPLPNVWRKQTDPLVESQYQIRQAQYLLPGERSVGCPWRCNFCQYTWIRGNTGGHYDPGMVVQEDNWITLRVEKPGRYITALDGWSEATRRRIHKPISDDAIRSKLRAIQALDLPSACVVKVYMIIGFPWETPESVIRDIAVFRQLLADSDAGCGGRVVLMFLVTPFSPEPMTPMQHDPVNMTEWRPVIEAAGRALYWSDHLEAFILPQIAGLQTLLRRVAINRCGPDNRAAVMDYVLGRGPLPAGVMSNWAGYPWLVQAPARST